MLVFAIELSKIMKRRCTMPPTKTEVSVNGNGAVLLQNERENPDRCSTNTREPESYDDVMRNADQANDQLRVHPP